MSATPDGPIICLGETLVDLICEAPAASLKEAEAFSPHFGGALANVAIAIARSGGSAAIAGGVGDDGWGRWLAAELRRAGVQTDLLALDPEVSTPLAFVIFDSAGEPTFIIHGEAMEAGTTSLEDRIERAVAGASALVFGSNTLPGEGERRVTLAARGAALAAGVPVCFDPNLRPRRWPGSSLDEPIRLSRAICEGATVVKLNAEEAALISGIESDPAAAAEALVSIGAKLCVVTLGPDGAIARGLATAEAPGTQVDVASPLGAGDAFFGALLTELNAGSWQGEAVQRALDAGVRAGAAACAQLGAQP